MDTFPEIDLPDWGLKNSVEARVEAVELGDGYIFREPVGLNYKRKAWSPTWSNLFPAVGEDTYDWLEERLNLTPFLWPHPVSGVVYQVVCTSVELTYDTWGNAVLNASFTQDFNPQ